MAALRKLRGMTQQEFAAALGRSESWVSQVERNVQPLDRLPVLQAVAETLGVAVDELREAAPAGDAWAELDGSLRRALPGDLCEQVDVLAAAQEVSFTEMVCQLLRSAASSAGNDSS